MWLRPEAFYYRGLLYIYAFLYCAIEAVYDWCRPQMWWFCSYDWASQYRRWSRVDAIRWVLRYFKVTDKRVIKALETLSSALMHHCPYLLQSTAPCSKSVDILQYYRSSELYQRRRQVLIGSTYIKPAFAGRIVYVYVVKFAWYIWCKHCHDIFNKGNKYRFCRYHFHTVDTTCTSHTFICSLHLEHIFT